QLEGVQPLDLPVDHLRIPGGTNAGASERLDLDASFREDLAVLSAREGVTLFMTLLTAFKVLLHRYSGQEDICVGSPVAGRQQEEIADLIGFFVNTLALRSHVDGSQTFSSLLQEVKQTTLSAYEHEDVPFEKIVEHLDIVRDLARNPVFQVMFVLQPSAWQELPSLSGLTIIREHLPEPATQFDLNLQVVESRAGLGIELIYNSSLYDSSTMRRMLSHYKHLLEAFVADSNQQIGMIPMLSEREKTQLLKDFNDTAAGYREDATIIGLFEEQVSRTPSSVALTLNGESLLYGELDARANQVGHYLRQSGVKAGDLVGICLDRSFEMVIGILGIQKAGATYVPIDPEYPAERIRYMIEDSGSRHVLTISAYQSLLGTGSALLFMDTAEVPAEPISRPVRKLSSSSAAYVIYTSGSTGQPKGVVVEHRHVVRLLQTDRPCYDFNSADVWPLFHSFCFDVSVWEMYGALFNGGRLVIVPRDTVRDVSRFTSLLIKEQVTVLNQTPSAFYALQYHVLH
ncbi:non-ribosomal peptide synthetase, partial [Chitinophaga oryziterrae]